MNGKESALAVLMESVEVRHVFPQWPEGMNLAVCLLDSGDCRMFIYRHEEVGGFPARIRQYVNLPVSEICVFPAVAGYPSRKLLYSDEQRLLALVADAPELVEEAIDYSANYLFALEEGLDPSAFLCRTVVANADREKSATASTKSTAGPAVRTKDEPGVRVKSAARARKPGKSSLPAFLRGADMVLPGPRFRSATQISAAEEPPGICRLEAERNGWIIIERPGGRGGDVRVSNPGSIFLRDDRRVIALRVDPAWPERDSLPTRIMIRVANLPRSLRLFLAENVGEAQLDSDGKFLFLQLPPAQSVATPAPVMAIMPAPERQPPEPVKEKTPRPRRRHRLWLAAGIASLLVLIGVGLRYGTPSPTRSDEPNASIDWNRYRDGGGPGQTG